jgi:hypothetical protein
MEINVMSKVNEFISTLALAFPMAAAVINFIDGNELVGIGFANMALLVAIFRAIEGKETNE